LKAPASDAASGKPAAIADATSGKPSVDVKDGQIAVHNKELDASRDRAGNDTVTDKRTGEVTSRDAQGDITDKTHDRTTTIVTIIISTPKSPA